jgi:hypothetical protein
MRSECAELCVGMFHDPPRLGAGGTGWKYQGSRIVLFTLQNGALKEIRHEIELSSPGAMRRVAFRICDGLCTDHGTGGDEPTEHNAIFNYTGH